MKKIFLIMVVLLTLASVCWAQGKITVEIESKQERDTVYALLRDRVEAMFDTTNGKSLFLDKIQEFCSEVEKTYPDLHPYEPVLVLTIIDFQDTRPISIKGLCMFRMASMIGVKLDGNQVIPQEVFALENVVDAHVNLKGFGGLSTAGKMVLRLWDEYFQSQMVEEMIIYQLAKEKGKSVEEMRKTWEKTKQKVQGGE